MIMISNIMTYFSKSKSCIFVLAIIAFFAFIAEPANATRLPKGTIELVSKKIEPVNKRLDGVLKTKSGDLYIPLKPSSDKSSQSKPIQVEKLVPENNPLLIMFNNGWAFIKLVKQNDKLLLKLPAGLSNEERLILKTKKLPTDLIVPQGMAVSSALKSTIGELDIEVLAGEKKPVETAVSKDPQKAKSKGPGKIFVTSSSTGKVVILKPDYEKSDEMQTDGTPSGMTCVAGKLYICDQTKNRILILDPASESFSGQINLKPGSSPSGIAASPDGRFLYVCTTATNSVSAIDLKLQKEVIRTRVRPGPTKIAITPNGYMLLVINGQSGEITFVSTLNQKAVGYAKVGELPSQIIVTNNSRAAFVSNRVSNTISIIDITHRRVANTIKVGDGPTGIALSPDETMLFVANAKDNTIIAYSTKDYSKVKDVQLPLDVEFPGKIVFVPGTNYLLVTSAATDTLGILDIESMEFIKQPRIGCTSDNAIWVQQ